MAFKMKGWSVLKQNDPPIGKKKIHESSGSHDPRLSSKVGELHRFTKGARTSTGTYTPSDVTVEKGKKITYVQDPDDPKTYKKTVGKKKKGAVSGSGTWNVKRSKIISEKKAKRQIKRKKRKYNG